MVLISYESKFYTLTLRFCPKFTGFHDFLFLKTIRYELRDSRSIQGFALIYEQSCCTVGIGIASFVCKPIAINSGRGNAGNNYLRS